MAQINTWPGWECVRQIGEGSFGKVYEIRRTEYGKTYSAALKVITIPQNPSEIDTVASEGMDQKSVTEYFLTIVEQIAHEIAIMSDLKGHSNIVSYEDHKVIPHETGIGWDILVRMELLTPLLEYEKQHDYSEEEVIKLGSDICRAMEICQARNIIHRDIKPENIFVNKDKDYKLGDFGIARTTERTVSNMSKKGTYTYMAPEVYLGKPYGNTADIYSLGMVLYRALNENRTAFLPTGTKIRFSDREQAIMKRIGGEPIPSPVNGSDELKRIVLRAISYYPEDRYQTASEFREDLQKCLDDVPEMVLEKTVMIDKAKADLEKTVSLYEPQTHVDQDSEKTIRGKTGSETDWRKKNNYTPNVEKQHDLDMRERSKIPLLVGAVVLVMLIGLIAVFVLGRGKNPGKQEAGKKQELVMASETTEMSEPEADRVDKETVLISEVEETELPAVLQTAYKYNDHYYQVYDEAMTWTQAKARCEEYGGHLMTVENADEQKFLVDLLEKYGSQYHYWLGGTDEDKEGTWRWVTGQVFWVESDQSQQGYANWEPKQPNNSISDDPEHGQDYLEIQVTRGDNSDEEYMTWTDISVDGVSRRYMDAPEYNDTQYYGFVCEWDSTDFVQ